MKLCLQKILILLVPALAVACTKTSMLDGKKKIIRQNRQGKAKSMDPQVQFDQYSADVIGMLFDGLYEYHYLKRPYELIPSIAADYPKYSADGLTMTIPLRSGVRFIDDKCFAGGKGREVNANDVVYTVKRFGDSSINDAGYGMLQGLIVGLDEFREKTKGSEFGSVDYSKIDVAGIKALDARTVQFKFTKPTTVVAYTLGNPVLAIVPHECTDMYKQEFGTHPVGTGPFKIKYRNRLGDLYLTKNDDYFFTYPMDGMPGDGENGLLKDAGKKLPLVDEVYSPVVEEFQPAMLRFLRGHYDWVAMDADAFIRMAYREAVGVFKLKPDYADKFNIYSEPDVGSYWFLFNMKDELLGKNLKLRKAMAMAMNRDGFIEDILNGRAMVIDSVVPPTISGNHIDTKSTFPNYNVEQAKKLLAEAGYPGGEGLPPIKFIYASGGTMIRQCEFWRRNLAEIGIKMEIDLTTYTAYVKKMEDGNFQFSLAGWHADYPDAENFLYWLTGPAHAELENYGNWQNKTYDALYKKIAGHVDSPERRELIRQMNEEVAQDIPIIPLYAPYRVGMIPKWTSNMRRSLMSGRQLQYLDVDPIAQKKGL